MRYLLVLVLTAATLQTFSQQLTLSVGPAFPVGAYGSKDGNDDASGLAKLGPMAELSYMHPIGTKHFGVAGLLRWRQNAFDKQQSVAPLAEQLPGFQWSTSGGSWKTAAAMAGAYYMAPVGGKWSFIGQMTVGVAEAWLPQINVKGIQDTTGGTGDANIVVAENKKTNSTTFSAMAKAGFAYHLTDRFSLTACVDYWYLSPDFTITQTVAYGQHLIVPGVYELSNASSINTTSGSASYTQKMNSINFTLGVAMKL